ncbi:MAG: pyridoxine 5'-phosphate synthase [Pelagibacteraceae bacterium TMED216]|nr:MAG: pyridoxine 5'-phosphate synthase [Pelagibacteraceae bacterium TMED216]|tara:strand:+ start:2280 stop:3008 length:729 start_codon:yes stop_codon:yes gene_type:complete
MRKRRLGVNIDHVATVRNARGETYPDPLKAAFFAKKNGADSVTIHLREDRRHIKDNDLKNIKRKSKIPINLEIAATQEMFKIAMKYKPHYICFVPEKRKEITTEGGLNLQYNKTFLKKIISSLKKNGSRISLFIEPKIKDIKLAKFYFNADCVELHTGKICRLINLKKNYSKEFNKIKKAVDYGTSIDIEIHAGHGITYKSGKILSKIKNIKEFNIGHFLIGESIFEGINNTIKKFKQIINK